MKQCKKCGATDRYPSGRCHPCAVEFNIKYRILHPEANAKACAKYSNTHPEVAARTTAKYRSLHREECEKYNIEWRAKNLDRVKVMYAKHTSKRRCLGYKPLNIWFHGSEGHHIGRDYVIFIPKELHRSVYHDFFKGINMKEINALALDFLFTSATI